MGRKRVSIFDPRTVALAAVLTCTVVALLPDTAVSRDKSRGAAVEEPGFFESVGRWFDKQADNIKSTFGGARSTVEGFSHEAGVLTVRVSTKRYA